MENVNVKVNSMAVVDGEACDDEKNLIEEDTSTHNQLINQLDFVIDTLGLFALTTLLSLTVVVGMSHLKKGTPVSVLPQPVEVAAILPMYNGGPLSNPSSFKPGDFKVEFCYGLRRTSALLRVSSSSSDDGNDDNGNRSTRWRPAYDVLTVRDRNIMCQPNIDYLTNVKSTLESTYEEGDFIVSARGWFDDEENAFQPNRTCSDALTLRLERFERTLDCTSLTFQSDRRADRCFHQRFVLHVEEYDQLGEAPPDLSLNVFLNYSLFSIVPRISRRQTTVKISLDKPDVQTARVTDWRSTVESLYLMPPMSNVVIRICSDSTKRQLLEKRHPDLCEAISLFNVSESTIRQPHRVGYKRLLDYMDKTLATVLISICH